MPQRSTFRAVATSTTQPTADTRLWAALQEVSGGTWGGSVFDVDAILRVIEAGRKVRHG